MESSIRRFLESAAVVIAFAATTSGASAQEVVATASGHANLQLEGGLRTFSFAAIAYEDGVVIGQAQLFNRSQGDRLHLEIDCMFLDESGTTATLSGVVTKSNNSEIPEGSQAFFAVQDNGEGKNTPADQVSLVFEFVSEDPVEDLCDILGSPPPGFLRPIDSGNIEMRW